MRVIAPDTIRPVRFEDGTLHLIDQRLLPRELREVPYRDAGAVAAAIRDMVVRGAPAIGLAAAFGVVLACDEAQAARVQDWRSHVDARVELLSAARPTAVNLFWALERMRRVLNGCADVREACATALAEAQAMLSGDIAANRRIGAAGAALIEPGRAVLTHCNAGSLATGGFGTALGVIRCAWAEGRISGVFADETRPWLQGARLTAWELVQDGIPVTLLCDGAAASLLASGRVSWVIVGADRIAANGDTANKIGTYGLALAARAHGVGFMVAAPTSTIDHGTADGSGIVIEERDEAEVLGFYGRPVAAAGAGGWNPAFDVTPAALIDAIVTECGVVRSPARAGLANLHGRTAEAPGSAAMRGS